MLARLSLFAALLLPAAARAEGMPQLDFANPLTTSQVVWGVIIFAVLYVLLARIGLPKVGEVIEQRARHIAADLETAQKSKAQADAADIAPAPEDIDRRRTRRRSTWPRRQRGHAPRHRRRSTRRSMWRSRRPRGVSRR